MIKQDRGTPFSVSAAGTSTATATQSGTTSVICYITDVSASTMSASGTVFVYGGTTVLWRELFAPSSGSQAVFQQSFSTPLTGAPGGAVSITANGTSATYVNISGFTINAS